MAETAVVTKLPIMLSCIPWIQKCGDVGEQFWFGFYHVVKVKLWLELEHQVTRTSRALCVVRVVSACMVYTVCVWDVCGVHGVCLMYVWYLWCVRCM